MKSLNGFQVYDANSKKWIDMYSKLNIPIKDDIFRVSPVDIPVSDEYWTWYDLSQLQPIYGPKTDLFICCFIEKVPGPTGIFVGPVKLYSGAKCNQILEDELDITNKLQKRLVLRWNGEVTSQPYTLIRQTINYNNNNLSEQEITEGYLGFRTVYD